MNDLDVSKSFVFPQDVIVNNNTIIKKSDENFFIFVSFICKDLRN